MRNLLVLCFFHAALSLSAQTKIIGFVKLQSSSNQSLKNAEVWAIGAASKPLRFSNDKGYFELEFPNKKVGDIIREISVTLDGYEVVNKKDLESYGLLRQPDDDPLIIVLCKQGTYRKAAADYYQTIYSTSETELLAKKSRLENPSENKPKNDAALQQQLTDINEKLKSLPQVAEAAADYFAKIDLDQATQLQKNALAELEKGNIQAALDAMPEEVMDKNMAAAQKRKQQLETQLAETKQVIQQNIENYLFKARLYVSNGDYAAAERLYEKAIAADTTNIENLYDYAVFLENSNRYDKALLWLQKVTTTTTEAWQRASAYSLMGRVYQETGDFTRAPLAYARYEAIYDSLYQQQPNNDFYKNGLAISYSKLGEIYQAQGKVDTALVFFQKDLKLTEALYRDNPKSEALKNGLAISYSKLGEIYQAQGKVDTALVFFLKCNQFNEALYRDNPKSEGTKNNLAISYSKLGEIYQAQGKVDTALVFFLKYNQFNEALYRDNPKSEETKNNLAISYSRLGDIYQAQGKVDTALVFFLKYNQFYEELYRDNPKNVELWFGLGVSYYKLGALYAELDSAEQAIGYYERAAKIFKDLYEFTGLNSYLSNYNTVQRQLEKLR